MLLTRANVFRRDLQNAVGINQEFHLDTRQAGRSRRNFQSEAREGTTVFREFSLALKHVNLDPGLVVNAGRVKLLRARGNRGIARNNLRYGAAVRFDPERERRDVEEQHVAHAALEDIGLNGGAQRDDFVGIQLRVRLAAEKFLHRAADERRARGAAHQDDFLDVGRLEPGIGKSLLHGSHGAVDNGPNERFEFTTGEFVDEDGAVGQRKTQRGRFGSG